MTFSIYKPIQIFFADLFLIHLLKYYYHVQQKRVKSRNRVIHDQTSTFLNSRNLLYNYQSGFRKNHSTDYCLSFLNDKILKGFDQGLITGMILIYKKPLIQSTMTFHCKNCMLLVSLNIQ